MIEPRLDRDGHPRRRGLRRMLMGSVAEMVMRRAQCPLLPVKEPTEEKNRNGKRDGGGGLMTNLTSVTPCH